MWLTFAYKRIFYRPIPWCKEWHRVCIKDNAFKDFGSCSTFQYCSKLKKWGGTCNYSIYILVTHAASNLGERFDKSSNVRYRHSKIVKKVPTFFEFRGILDTWKTLIIENCFYQNSVVTKTYRTIYLYILNFPKPTHTPPLQECHFGDFHGVEGFLEFVVDEIWGLVLDFYQIPYDHYTSRKGGLFHPV